MLFSQRLRSIRNEKNLSQKEFAVLLGINAVTLSHYENGKREPDLDRFATLCQKLSVSADYLLGLSENITPITVTPVSIAPVSIPRSDTNPLDELISPYLDQALDFIEYQYQKQTATLTESKIEVK